MTVVMSKLRDLSERFGIPYPYMTRAISGTIVVLYVSKISYPFVENYLFRKKDDPKSKLSNVEQELNISTESSKNNSAISIEVEISSEDEDDNYQQTLKRRNNQIDDNLIRLAYNRKQRSQQDRYLTFGPKRSSKILLKLEELLIKFLLEIRHLIGINIDFVIQLIKLIRIMVPKVACTEVLILIMHTVSLISRTFLSIYVANLEGRVVKYIVRRDLQQFTTLMCKWLLISVPATFLNSLIRYLESKLSLSFRSRLVNYAYGLYFNNETYYSVSNLDSRLENADHSLTDDITTFAQHCAHMYSHVTKPLLDVVVVLFTLFRMGRKMGSNGMHGPMLGASIVFFTHLVLRKCSPEFGKLVSEEARRKGYLRFVHSRVITNAEEIAFYRGGYIERHTLEKAYRSLTKQMNVIFHQRLWYVMLEQLLMKYIWSATGLVVIATPIMLNLKHATQSCPRKQLNDNSHDFNDDISDRTEYMMTAKNILISGSDAMERLLSSYKEVKEFIFEKFISILILYFLILAN